MAKIMYLLNLAEAPVQATDRPNHSWPDYKLGNTPLTARMDHLEPYYQAESFDAPLPDDVKPYVRAVCVQIGGLGSGVQQPMRRAGRYALNGASAEVHVRHSPDSPPTWSATVIGTEPTWVQELYEKLMSGDIMPTVDYEAEQAPVVTASPAALAKARELVQEAIDKMFVDAAQRLRNQLVG